MNFVVINDKIALKTSWKKIKIYGADLRIEEDLIDAGDFFQKIYEDFSLIQSLNKKN